MEGETGGEITKRNKKSKWGNRRMYESLCVCLCDRERMCVCVCVFVIEKA